MEKEIRIGFKDADGNPTQPLPKQLEGILKFNENKHTVTAGSLGWGKTDWLVAIGAAEALEYPRNEILIGRKHLGSFNRSTRTSFDNMIPSEMIKRENKQLGVIELLNGTKFHYVPLDGSKEAMKKIQGMNLGLALIDQIEEISEEVFLTIVGRLRRTNASRKTASTCNPAGHDWIWKRWVQKKRPGHGLVEGSIWRENTPPPTCQRDVTFATCDNPYLPWDYIRTLLTDYPERWVKRFIYGSWENFEGLVWPAASRNPWPEGHSVQPRKIPDWWNKYIFFDWGHRNPSAAIFVAVDDLGTAWIYDCYYSSGEWVDYHAAALLQKMKDTSFSGMYADPSMFSERDSEYTIARQFEEFGIFFERANNDKQGGIDHVGRMWEQNRIKVFNLPEFEPFWEEVENYRWSEMKAQTQNDPEEPIKRNDHFPDCTRYMANHLVTAQKPKPPSRTRYLLSNHSTRPEKAYMGV